MSKHTKAVSPSSIQHRMRRAVVSLIVPVSLTLILVLATLIWYNRQYVNLLHNVTTASDFNQDFKSNIDLKMYYYVIESQYSEGLPIDEVHSAQALAQDLLSTTTQSDSQQAISSVLDLCRNLEEKIYLIRDTDSYDERQPQLENNIYVLTSLIQEYMYDYLYYEAVQLSAIQSQIAFQIIVELVLVLAVTAGLIFFAFRRSVALGNSITGPIVELSDRVGDISRGDLTVREPIQSDSYEITALSQGIEQMVERLNALIRESTQKQESLRRAELALLQAQINPHFLYNTMDTIIWLIEAGRSQQAQEMVANLSDFFRHSLSKGEDIITLETEQRHVLSYLQIQQVRYRDILSYTVDIDPALLRARLPKLTLQPLVENALYHGIKLKRGPGHIDVTGCFSGADILLRVTDDGVGISPARLRELEASMGEGERVGFGLSTVHERLQLYFGPDWGLSINSKEGVGTTVTVRIPYQEQEDEV